MALGSWSEDLNLALSHIPEEAHNVFTYLKNIAIIRLLRHYSFVEPLLFPLRLIELVLIPLRANLPRHLADQVDLALARVAEETHCGADENWKEIYA